MSKDAIVDLCFVSASIIIWSLSYTKWGRVSGLKATAYGLLLGDILGGYLNKLK